MKLASPCHQNMFPPARGHPVVTGFLFLSRIACERGHPPATGFLFSSVRASILVRASGAHWLPCFPALHRTGFQVCLASSSMTRTTIHAVAFMRASTCEWLPLLSCRSSARGHPLVKDLLFCTSSHWFHVLLLFRCATWMSFLFPFVVRVSTSAWLPLVSCRSCAPRPPVLTGFLDLLHFSTLASRCHWLPGA